MSLAQLFYLKESIRQRIRRRVRQNTPPRTSQFTMEPLENRLLLSMTPVVADLTSVLPNATNLEPTAITQAVAPNQTVSFQLDYQDTGSGAGTTGLGLRIHYNSNQLRPGEAGPDSQFGTGDDVAVLTNLFGGTATTLKIGPQGQADTNNFDGDASTDRFVLMSWADFSGQFPKGPAALFTSNWTTTADFSGTTVNFTTSSRPPGRALNATSADITLDNTTNPVALTRGVTTSGTISAAGETDSYTFTGAAGDVVAITLAGTPNTPFNAVASLFGPTGTLVQAGFAGQQEFTLAAAGTYVLKVSDRNFVFTGDYGLEVEGITPPSANAVGLMRGETQNTTIAQMGETDLYTFTAEAGDVVAITLAGTPNTPFNAVASLFGPTGTLVQAGFAGQQEFTLAAGGTYVLKVSDRNFIFTGDYGLEVEGITPPSANAVALTRGETQNTNIAQMGETDLYTFTAEAGDVVAITLAGTPNTPFNAVASLFGPTGTLVQAGFAGQREFTLAAAGTYVLKVSDRNFVITGNYQLTVNADNQAPVLGAIGNRTVDEGTALTFTIHATDVDVPPDTLTYSASGLPTGATFDPSTRTFSWTPTESQGPQTYTGITFTVADGQGGTDSETISITVNEVNQAPVLDTIGNKTVTVGQPLTFTVTATDADLPANVLAFSSTTLPAGASFDATTGQFSWTPVSGQLGQTNLIFTVQDNGTPPLSDSEPLTITVRAEPNANPLAVNDGPYAATEDQLLTVLAAQGVLANDSDANGDSLSATLLTQATNGIVTLASDGGFTYQPNANFNGSDSFTYTVSDGRGGTATGTASLTVAADNDAPVLGAIGNKTVQVGQNLTFTLSATDIDVPANVLTFSASGLPTGATFDPTTRTFSWTPTVAQVGNSGVTFTVNDGQGGTDSETITIGVTTVSNTNPVLGAIGNRTVDEGQALTFTLSATDADSPTQPLVFSASGLPLGATFDPTTRTFSWTPTEAQGPNTFTGLTFTVNDGQGGTDSETISITVNEVNQAPVLGTIGNKTVQVGQNLTFTISATDADVPVNALTFSATGLPTGATFDATTRTFSWTPSAGQLGDAEVSFTVQDDGSPKLSHSETITINVTPIPNRNPVADDDTYTIGQDQVLNIDAPGVLEGDTDADGDTLSVIATDSAGLQGEVLQVTDGSFIFTPTAGFTGTTSYRYTVGDLVGGTDTGTVTITVEPVDVAPTVTINQAGGQADPTSASPILFDVVFSEAVTGFDATDVSFAGSTAGGTLQANVTGSGSTYQVAVSGMTSSGEVVASLGPGAATDSGGNGSAASTSTDNTVTFTGVDDEAPTVRMEQGGAQEDPTSQSPIWFDVTFSEAVTGFGPEDINFAGSTVSGQLTAEVLGSGSTYLVLVSGMTSSGLVVASVLPGAATDAAGNPNSASTGPDNGVTFVVNNAAPIVNSVGTILEENSVAGTEVGFVSATDPDPGQALTFSILSGNDHGAFAIDSSSGRITVANSAVLDFESTAHFTLTVQALDNGVPALSASNTFDIQLVDVNEAPNLTAPATKKNPENTTTVATVTANDPDAGATLSFTLSGTDGAKFRLDGTGSTRTLRFVNAPDFERPTDAGRNNVYNVTVTVSDGTFSESKSIVVTVTDVREGGSKPYVINGTKRGDNIVVKERNDGRLSVTVNHKTTQVHLRSGQELRVFGLDGNDRIVLDGLKRAVLVDGGAGHDTIDASRVSSSRASLVLRGGAGGDLLVGGTGHDRVEGGDGEDVLVGNKGNDRLLGGNGNDLLIGGLGRDVLEGNNGDDALLGGPGRDSLYGGQGKDTLIGGREDAVLNGGPGSDLVLKLDRDAQALDKQRKLLSSQPAWIRQFVG